jgi:hypothetical protein
MPHDPDTKRQQLLYSRAQAGVLLGGISTRKLILLEKQGRLVPVTMTVKGLGQRFYRHDDLMKFIDEMSTAKVKRRKLRAA